MTKLRKLSANFKLFDAKALVLERRAKREEAFHHQPRLWAGTIDHWSLYEEPYKQGLWGWPDVYLKEKERANLPKGTMKGLGVSRGVVEGVARIVTSPAQFDDVKEGRDPRLHHDQSCMGRALHEDCRPGHRFRRRVVASGRGLA